MLLNCTDTIEEKFEFFFFQAEDGIRDPLVTGVQTCALSISTRSATSENRPKLVPAPSYVAPSGWLSPGHTAVAAKCSPCLALHVRSDHHTPSRPTDDHT